MIIAGFAILWLCLGLLGAVLYWRASNKAFGRSRFWRPVVLVTILAGLVGLMCSVFVSCPHIKVLARKLKENEL